MQNLNYREVAGLHGQHPKVKQRAINMDCAIHTAYSNKLPIRVIVLNGKMRDKNNPNTTARVEKRLLDSVPWTVTAYDDNNGKCTVTRGALVDPLFRKK